MLRLDSREIKCQEIVDKIEQKLREEQVTVELRDSATGNFINTFLFKYRHMQQEINSLRNIVGDICRKKEELEYDCEDTIARYRRERNRYREE
jgi:hypothetical protein